MKKVFYMVCIAFIMMINACENNIIDEPDRNVASERLFRSYINTFVECKKLNVSYLAGLEINEEKKIFITNNTEWNSMWPDTVTHEFFSVTDGIVVFIEGLAKDSSGYFYDVPQTGSDDFLFSNGHSPNEPFYLQRKIGYDQYIALIGDTLFNKKATTTIAAALLDTLSSIIITASKDFDVNHSAGTNLSSLFSVYFYDPYAFVKNGYQPPEGTYNNNDELFIAPPDERIYAPLFKAELLEANFAERPFIGNEWYCLLDVAPEKTGEYIFHVKITLVDGTVLESQSPPINIKGAND
jgi:hypothetical protein